MNFLGNPNHAIVVQNFIPNLVLAAVLAWLLGRVYGRFGQSLSNRRMFARNFVLLTMTTTLIISIVKSSLALSLGLVGALSIVRFRAAIKEPEELAYLFLAISIGLGLGAGQTLVTVVAFAAIVLVLIVRGLVRRRKPDAANLCLTVTSPGPQKLGLTQILDTVAQVGATAVLKRFDESPERLEALFHLAGADAAKIEGLSQRLRTLNDRVHVAFLEDRVFGS